MATLEELAPDLAPHLTVEEAKAIDRPKPPDTPTSAAPTKERVLEAVAMLAWVGAQWIPASAPKIVRDGVGISDVARKTGLDLELCQRLYTQVKAIQAEAEKGDDAFKPSPKPEDGPGK